MRAVQYSQYGPPEVLSPVDIPEPPPAEGEVRVRVEAAALNPKDVLIRKGRMKLFVGHRFPRTPGYDIAGTLMDAAPDIGAGTKVYGMIQSNAGGGCAEVVRLPVSQIAPCPVGLTMTEAAAIPLAGLTALQALRDHLKVQPGQRVLCNGASGGVGTFAVQIVKALGAHCIAVCSSRNEELVASLGADEVIDYTRQPPDEVRELDGVFDIYGSFPWPQARSSLKPSGRYCTTIPALKNIARAVLNLAGLHRAGMVVVRSHRNDLMELSRMVQSAELRPVVDRVFELHESADAHRYLETRRARGKVVIRIATG